MMTMTHSTADDDPRRHRSNLIGIDTPSKSLREPIALKDGPRGIDSPRYQHLTILREIATRNLTSVPTVAVVDCHDDDAIRQQHKTCPDLFPTQTDPNSVPLSPQPPTDDFDRTLARIEQRMRSWPSAKACKRPTVVDCDDAARPRQTHPNPSPHPKVPISIPPFLPSQSTDGDYVDRTLAKIDKIMRSWPAAIARERWMLTMPTTTQHPPPPEPYPDQLAPSSTIPDITQMDFPALASSDGNDSADRSRTQDVPSLSLQDTFVLQLKVLDKLNLVCDGIGKLLDRCLTARTRPPTHLIPCQTTPKCTTPATITTSYRPSLFPDLTPKLLPQPRTTPAWKKLITNVNLIPAKPPYRHVCCHLAPTRTKDRMRPP